VELVAHGVLPGTSLLDAIDGACDVDPVPLVVGPVGPTRSGTFFSTYRRTRVGYTIAWPPGHQPGDLVALVIMLHGYRANHAHTVSGMSPAQLVALRVNGRPLTPMALATVDGGDGYWHPHPSDDPMGMVIHELIPMCQRAGLGRDAQGVAITGISMGGYGAIATAEHHRRSFRAAAAISPAIWTSWNEAHGANPGAFTDPAEFAAYDAVTHATMLGDLPIRVAVGASDPFLPGVRAFIDELPAGDIAVISGGCHSGAFFTSQEPATMAFLSRHLAVLSS
jgi:pimeloyl-ACP methyl ester carboxylesterase